MKITNLSKQVIHNVTSSSLYKNIDNNIHSCYITINTSSYYRVIDRSSNVTKLNKWERLP